MEIKEIDKAVRKIVEKKVELSNLDYADSRYDEVEEALHDMEDEFVENYGSYFEDVLTKIHEEYCLRNEVLLPTAYFANEYKKIAGQESYDVTYSEGVVVESDKVASKVARLVIVPCPVRILFQSQVDKVREEAWNILQQEDAV